MKKILFFILAATLTLVSVGESKAQCNGELYTDKALKELSIGYTFVKSYRVDGRAGNRKKIEYTCVFSKDTNYEIKISSKDGGGQVAAKGIIATLFDSKRNKLASNFVNNKFFDGWTYKCRATGIYYLQFTFKNSTSYCGAGVLGFRR